VHQTTDGLLDTNVFLHAQANDTNSDECRRFLGAIERGEAQAILDPIILHELSYALPRYARQMTKNDVVRYLQVVLSWPGILGDKAVIADAVQRWHDTAGLAFVDAYLAERASSESRPVYTKNVRELRGQGVDVPDPLPAG